MGVANTNTIHMNMSVQEDASASYMTVRHTAYRRISTRIDILSNNYNKLAPMIYGNNGALLYMYIRMSIRMIR